MVQYEQSGRLLRGVTGQKTHCSTVTLIVVGRCERGAGHLLVGNLRETDEMDSGIHFLSLPLLWQRCPYWDSPSPLSLSYITPLSGNDRTCISIKVQMTHNHCSPPPQEIFSLSLWQSAIQCRWDVGHIPNRTRQGITEFMENVERTKSWLPIILFFFANRNPILFWMACAKLFTRLPCS